MKINDIKKVGKNKYIWLACNKCGKERWVNYYSRFRPNYEGCCKKCSGNHAKPPRYEGRFTDQEGYNWIQLMPTDPFIGMALASNHFYAREHRLIMAKYLNRILLNTEVVHHKNGIRNDNRIENLEILTFGSHVAFHNSNGAYRGR